MWNPCFLPALILTMYAFLYSFTIKGSRWALCGALVFFVLGFQIHFSVLMTIPVLLVALIMALRWPGFRVISITLLAVGLLFMPYMISELSSNSTNTEVVLEAPDAVKDPAVRYAFNPVAWRNFIHIVTFDWSENPFRLGFTYLYYIRSELQISLGENFKFLSNYVRLIGGIHLLFWLIGFFSIFKSLLSFVRMRRDSDPTKRDYHTRIAKAHLLLLLWQVIPLPFLSFFNFHLMMNNGPSLIPLRYYLITFPAQFIIAGIGFTRVAVLSIAAMRAVLCILLAICATYAAIDAAYLRQMKISGIAIPYLYFRTPT
ncbi:MAG TPA: hypothetical protein PK988_12645, partial [Candidatus Sumerlaeota bacterium]|nr:hypothetical protein [Candidatus Sumerlaeota bacterium]